MELLAHESLLLLYLVRVCAVVGVGVASRFEGNVIAHRSLLLLLRVLVVWYERVARSTSDYVWRCCCCCRGSVYSCCGG